MTLFYLEISDSIEAETSIDVPNPQEAMNAALNALVQFACRNFPPPEKLVIKVSDADRDHIATLRFGFSIDYAERSLT
jgi:hypothetical protein